MVADSRGYGNWGELTTSDLVIAYQLFADAVGGLHRNENARKLLLLYLDDKQRQEYEERGTLTCVGNETGNVYLILPKPQINIRIVENKSNHSRGKKKACILPEKTMPLEDLMLGQLLLIQNNERKFLENAVYW